MLCDVFLGVVRMGMVGTLVCGVAALAGGLLGFLHAPRWAAHLLWLAALFRLLCPVSFTAPVSALAPALLQRIEQATSAQSYVGDYTVFVEGQPGYDQALQAGILPNIRVDGGRATPYVAVEQTPAGALAPARTLRETYLPWLAGAWLAGALGTAAYGLARAWQLRRRVALAWRCPDGAYTCPQVDHPFVWGLGRPRIYLPPHLHGETRRYILLHERAHLRRGDHWVKPLFFAALCLHWYNPLLRLAFRALTAQMEAACDEAVVRVLGAQAKPAYCQSLLDFSVCHRCAEVLPGFGGGDVQRRVRGVLRYKKPALWLALAALAGCGALALLCLANPSASPSPSGDAVSLFIPQPAVQPTAAPSPASEHPAPGQTVPPDEAEPALAWPVPSSQSFSREFSATHYGVDIIGQEGCEIRAAAGGVVTAAGFGALDTSYGVVVQIDHGSGLTSLYAHCSQALVEVGQQVEEGQLIALMGNTGKSTGIHCHFELQRDGERVDPLAHVERAP